MANKTFSGYLKDPLGEYSADDLIRFTHITTTGSVIAGSSSLHEVSSTGYYSITIEYGTVVIESRSAVSKRWYNHGSVTINSDTTATTLPSLLLATTPVTDATIIELEALLADATEQADNAADSATAAAASATSAETSATAFYESNPANIDWIVDLPLKSGKLTDCLSGALTVSRSTTAYTINNSGKLTSIAANVAATSKRGVDVFDSVTTLQTIDSTLNTLAASGGGTLSVTSNLALDSSTYWVQLVPTDSGTTVYRTIVGSGTVTNSTYITTSLYVKKSTGSVALAHFYRASVNDGSGSKLAFNSDDGTYTSIGSDVIPTVIDHGSFYRIALTTKYLDANSTSAYYSSRISRDGETTAEIWGVNVTNTYYLAPYIPTTTAAATRAADVISFPVNDNFTEAGQPFTILMDLQIPPNLDSSQSSGKLFGLGSGTRLLYADLGSDGIVYLGWSPNGTSNSRTYARSVSSFKGALIRLILSFDGVNLTTGVDGVTGSIATDFSSLVYDTNNITFYVGAGVGGGSAAKTQISAFKIANFALTEDQIKALGAV